MATYYKYAEREAKNQIDWSEVGSQLTNTLKKEAELREAKKKALDDASRQFGEELENAPQGMSDDVNKYITDYAGDMQQYRLMTDRLLKSGQLKPKDYALIRQNSKDGTKRMFDLAKEYQDEFAIKTERRKNGESSEAETQFMAMVEGFANLSQTKALINPTTGAISIGKMVDKDGVRTLAEGPDNYMTVNQLRNRIKEKIDKFQLNESLSAEVKIMGEVVNEVVAAEGSATKTGFLRKITDPTLRKGLSQEGQQAADKYIETEKLIIEAQLSNPSHVSSILFDWTDGLDPKTGKPFQVTLDPKVAESSSHYILWSQKNGVFQPDFESTKNGKDQYKFAEQYAKDKFRGMLEQKTEMDAFSQPRKEPTYYPPEYVYRRGDEKKTSSEAGNMIAYLYSGTVAQQQAATDYFFGGNNVAKVKRTNDGIEVTYDDGRVKPIAFRGADGNLKSLEDFTRSATKLLLGESADVKTVVDASLKTKDKTFKEGEATSEGKGPKKAADPNKAFSSHLDNTFTEAAFKAENASMDEETFVEQFQPMFNALGFTASIPWTSGEYIVLESEEGKKSAEIPLKNPAIAAKSIKAFMQANVPGKDAAAKAEYLFNLQKSGVLKGGELD